MAACAREEVHHDEHAHEDEEHEEPGRRGVLLLLRLAYEREIFHAARVAGALLTLTGVVSMLISI